MYCFKEWQRICDALQDGTQSLILRKGGIHEGNQGFQFDSTSKFLLFPTRFHAQASQVKGEGDFTPGQEWELGQNVSFQAYCEVVEVHELEEWDRVASLDSYHQWTEACIKARYEWQGKAIHSHRIHLALVRVYALDQPFSVPYSKAFGGCRSWVKLPEHQEQEWAGQPVLSAVEFEAIRRQIQDIVQK